MQKNFKALSLSRKNAPVEIRELVALNEHSCRRLLQYLKDFTDANDVLVLSTCNRTEIYFSSSSLTGIEIIKLIGIEKGIGNINDYASYFTIFDRPKEAVQHLFDVAIGLESQVVGDMQITNQVKKAYQWTADADLAGPFLHRLLHTIFFTNKRVVQETSFRDGAASVSYAAVELVETLVADITDPKILILGVGETGSDVCRNLSKLNIREVYIANRTAHKSEALASECGFKILPFDNVGEAIQEADVIISSICKDTPFITKEMVLKADILTHKYFIDLSVPRSIATAIEEIPGALLYNIDHIQNKASEALGKRTAAIPQVQTIISEMILDFNKWSKEMVVSPTIHKLKNALEEIRKEEIAKFLKDLNDSESKKVEKITKSMMQKIIKLPVLQLKAACKRGEAEDLIGLINDLFDLEKKSEKTNNTIDLKE